MLASVNVAAMLYNISDVKQTMLLGRMDKTREVVLLARGVLDQHKADADAGRVPVAVAKARALEQISRLRFDGDNYFYAYDYDGTLLMHPFRPDLVGQPRLGATSPDGKRYVEDLIRVARAGGGFYRFAFNNGNQHAQVRPKLSYGVGVDEWRVALGAGLYIDDVERTYVEKAVFILGVGLLATAAALAVALAVARSISRPLGIITARMGELANGCLAVEVPYRTQGDEVGRLARALAVFKSNQDAAIAALHRNAVELERARDVAEKADRAKSAFLSAASHDLRQPMQALVMYLDILKSLELTGEAADCVQEIDQVVRIVTDMLNVILDISRLDSGTVAVKAEDVPLARLFEDLRRRFGLAAAAKGLDLIIGPTAAVVRSDPALLGRVLGNLLENAIRYTPSGTVRVGCVARGDEVVLEVRDTGIGVAPEHLAEIWDEYYQVGNPERDRAKGLGLGLSIVKRTAALLGHRVTATSAPGIGSCFSVTLPCVPGTPMWRAETLAVPRRARGL